MPARTIEKFSTIHPPTDIGGAFHDYGTLVIGVVGPGQVGKTTFGEGVSDYARIFGGFGISVDRFSGSRAYRGQTAKLLHKHNITSPEQVSEGRMHEILEAESEETRETDFLQYFLQKELPYDLRSAQVDAAVGLVSADEGVFIKAAGAVADYIGLMINDPHKTGRKKAPNILVVDARNLFTDCVPGIENSNAMRKDSATHLGSFILTCREEVAARRTSSKEPYEVVLARLIARNIADRTRLLGPTTMPDDPEFKGSTSKIENLILSGDIEALHEAGFNMGCDPVRYPVGIDTEFTNANQMQSSLAFVLTAALHGMVYKSQAGLAS